MHAATMLSPQNDSFFVGRRILALVRDPNSNANRISRLITLVPELVEAVMDSAEVHFEGRGPIRSVSHAITLIGYRRLDCVVRHFLRGEYIRLESEGHSVYQSDWSRPDEDGADMPTENPLDAVI